MYWIASNRSRIIRWTHHIRYFSHPIKKSSVNGSPVDQFDHGEIVVTSKKRRAVNSKIGGANKAPSSFPISIGIGAGNGETIDLSDPNQRKNLDGEQKAHAMQQLMAIQEQMNKLMEDF